MRTQQGTDLVSLLYAKQILMKKQITIDTQFSERAEGSFPDGRSRIKYLRHQNNINIEYKKLRSATNILGDFCYVQVNCKIESDMAGIQRAP